MVNFICDACGQTIKKQKVEKHYQTECRNCSVLSGIDCGKDFPGDSYVSHTSCISEAEKYQGKLYKAKEKANKGERKQQEWLEQVRSASSDSNSQDPRIRKLMAKITSYNNVPRKEAKFKKFCENSINIQDQALLEKLWKTFSGARHSNVLNNKSNDDHNSNKNVPKESTDTSLTSVNATSENSESKTAESTAKQEDKSDQIRQNNRNEIKKEKKMKQKKDTEENGTWENSETKTIQFVDQEEMNPSVSRQKNRQISKQEKKKKRLMEMEDQVEQVNGIEKDSEIVERKNKKKKKRKMEDDLANNNEEETAVGNKKKKKIKYETVETEQNENKNEQNANFGKKRRLKNVENIVEPNALPTDCSQEYETGQNEQNVETQEKFKWEAVIKKVLKSVPDNEMSVKKLRKKVINEFLTHGGDSRSRTEVELRALFEKKLHKNPKVKVHKEKAKYCK